jgi:hypothetical protein
MPTRSPQDVPAGSIRTLGLPARAVTVLTRAGITSVEDLAVLSRRELAAISGLGPGLLAAIRAVVPEPGQRPAERPTAGPDVDQTEEESPAAPPIPSFESLRAPRRSSAVDLLVPGPPAAAPRPAAPRPPDYTDLLRLGVHLTRVLVAVPVRMVCWSVAGPVRGLRRLLGAGQVDGPQV